MIGLGVLFVLAATAGVVRRIQRSWYLEDRPHVSHKTLDKINRLYPHGS